MLAVHRESNGLNVAGKKTLSVSSVPLSHSLELYDRQKNKLQPQDYFHQEAGLDNLALSHQQLLGAPMLNWVGSSWPNWT